MSPGVAVLDVFGLEFGNDLSITSNLSICKLWLKTKVPKYGTRNAWKYANVLKLEFENGILIFEINTLEFVYLQNLANKQQQKKKPLKFEIKNVLFGYISARILKILLSYLKSSSCSLSFYKIGPKPPDFGNFGLEFENNFVIIEINPLEIV